MGVYTDLCYTLGSVAYHTQFKHGHISTNCTCHVKDKVSETTKDISHTSAEKLTENYNSSCNEPVHLLITVIVVHRT